jgi:hypothetical protein
MPCGAIRFVIARYDAPAKARGLDALLTGLLQIKADEQRA